MQGDRSHLRLTLTSLDVLGTDAELRAQAEQALRERDPQPAPGLHAGRDETGSVTVFLADDGQVQDVTVARDWLRRIGPAGVGEALFDAYAAATRSTIEAAVLVELQQSPATSAADAEAAAEAARPAEGRRPGAETAGSDEAADHQWLQRVWQTLHDIDTDLEDLARQRDVVPEQTVTSPHGSLTARHRAGGIVSITGDRDLLADLDAGQLQYEAHALLSACAEIRSQSRGGHNG